MSETVNNYSTIDYSKILNDRIYTVESNIIKLQKGIDNLQYNQSIQSSQTDLIKVRNSILAGATGTTFQRRITN